MARWVGLARFIAASSILAVIVTTPPPVQACTVDVAIFEEEYASQRALWNDADGVVLARLERRVRFFPQHVWLQYRTLASVRGTDAPRRLSWIYREDRECGYFAPQRGDVVVAYLERRRAVSGLAPWFEWSVMEAIGPSYVLDSRMVSGLRAAANRLKHRSE